MSEHQKRLPKSPRTVRSEQIFIDRYHAELMAKQGVQYKDHGGVPDEQCRHLVERLKCAAFCRDAGKKGKKKYTYECYKR